MNNAKNTKRGSFYWVKNTPYPSVTGILSVIDKPALRYWFGREVYFAMVKNPSLQEREALAAPYQTSGEAKERGSTVHSIVESYKTTGRELKNIPPKYQGYAQAFYKWLDDNDIEILEQESTVFSNKHNYAGTLDLLVKFKKSGKICVIDVKTGKDIYDEAYIQLSAYAHALKEEGKHIDCTGVVLLSEDGAYKYGQGTDCFEVFLAAKQIWSFKNREMIKKLTKEG